MGVYTQLPKNLEEVDVVVVGGGTAGCIVAARLSEADANLSVLVIEGGENNENVLSIIHPVLFLGALMPTSTTTLFYNGQKEPQIANRQLSVPAGGVLGGGSSINLMMYSRAQRHDWDSWNMPGWSADEILPYLKKLEHYHAPDPKGVHGDSGPIAVSGGTYRADRAQDDFIAAAAQVGYSEIDDLQDLDSNNGVQKAQRFIGPDGRRSDTAHAYLHPKLNDSSKFPNLHLLVQSQVIRVLFDGTTATGVEFRGNPKFQSDTSTRSIKASKMVILASGALSTPSIVERSGVGDPSILEAANVPLVAHVPGVGANYQDHHLLTYAYRSSLRPDETIDPIVQGRVDVGELLQTNGSILGWNAQDVTCKLRPTESDVAALGSEFQEAYDRDFKSNSDKPMTLMSLLGGFPGDPTGLDPGQYFAISAFTVYPYSRGYIHINSSDPDKAADFVTGFFKDPLDVKKHVWSYKKQREIVRRMQNYRGEIAAAHPPFPKDSQAAPITIEEPLTNVTDIQYTAEDDAIIEQWARGNVGTTWHSLGTCAMAPLEAGGVVDASLGVYGVQKLKIADMSIVPKNVAANTANTAMVIGEKAADIFIQELGH
ncbi:hypothetical protein LQW54_007604 [Pestalotiopsis sp. IQ-011]